MRKVTASAATIKKFAKNYLGIEMQPVQARIAKAFVEGKEVTPSHQSGRNTARLVATAYLDHQGSSQVQHVQRLLRDETVIGVDFGLGKDKAVTVKFKTPGAARRFMRKVRLDRSKWEYKLIDHKES